MTSLDRQLVVRALRRVGDAITGAEPVRLVLTGGVAALLAGVLRPSRTTADCDVLWGGSDDAWARVRRAAEEVAPALGLPANWLNRDASMFAWSLPLGWTERCEPVGTFGVLEVVRLGRLDLIAAKVFSGPRRPQDVTDLRDIRPTGAELDFVLRHLDRLEAEDLDRRTFDDQRAIVATLRGVP